MQRANRHAFLVTQHGEVDCPRDMILLVLEGGAHIDDGIKTVELLHEALNSDWAYRPAHDLAAPSSMGCKTCQTLLSKVG